MEDFFAVQRGGAWPNGKYTTVQWRLRHLYKGTSAVDVVFVVTRNKLWVKNWWTVTTQLATTFWT